MNRFPGASRRSATIATLWLTALVSPAFAGLLTNSAPPSPPSDSDFRPEIIATYIGGRNVAVYFPERGTFAANSGGGRASPINLSMLDPKRSAGMRACSRYEREPEEEFDPDIRADCETLQRLELQRLVARELTDAQYDSASQTSRFFFERIGGRQGIFTAGNGLRAKIDTEDAILARVRLIAVTREGESLVSVESLRQAADHSLAWRASIFRYDRGGRPLDQPLEIRDTDGRLVYGDYLVGNEAGEIGLLRVDGDTVAVEWRKVGQPALHGRNSPFRAANMRAAALAPLESGFDAAEFALISTKIDGDGRPVDRPVAREDVLDAIDDYLTDRWDLSAANHSPALANECRPEARLAWQRPRQLGVPRKDHIGVPYKWGGYVSLESFERQIEKGFAAGNICACERAELRYCVLDNATGIDATGLVSRVWRTRRLTTSTIEEVSDPIPLGELRPGDALLKRGEHVRLYLGTVTGHKEYGMHIVESSISCGGVCEKILTARELDGYTPRRYKQIRD